MVIQRWQNLLLLIAVVLMCVFCATPYAVAPGADGAPAPVYVSASVVYLILNLVIAVLLVIALFFFRNLKAQMTVTLVSAILICASLITCGCMVCFAMPEAHLLIFGGISLPIVALVCAVAAYRFMRKDRNLLRSYDRLR